MRSGGWLVVGQAWPLGREPPAPTRRGPPPPLKLQGKARATTTVRYLAME